MADSNVTGVVLLKDERLGDTVGKWLAWLIVMVVFVLLLVYISNYFTEYNCDLERQF